MLISEFLVSGWESHVPTVRLAGRSCSGSRASSWLLVFALPSRRIRRPRPRASDLGTGLSCCRVPQNGCHTEIAC